MMFLGGRPVRTSLKIVTADGKEVMEPYLLRLAGWTEERYFQEAPEMQMVEFADGDLIVHSPANIRHQQIIGFLTMLLRGYVRSKNLGEVLNGPGVVQLRPGLDYEPDICFVTREQCDLFNEQYFSGAPTHIMEVVSPGTRHHDLVTKATHYQEYGVPEYCG